MDDLLPDSDNSDDWETDNSSEDSSSTDSSTRDSSSVQDSSSDQNIIENRENQSRHPFYQSRNSSPEIIELSTDSDDYLSANSESNNSIELLEMDITRRNTIR